MITIQAAVLRVKLNYIETWNEQRRARAATYHRLFAEAGLGGAGAPITLPRTAEYAHHVFHQYVIRALRRDELRAFLAQRGIATEIYYPIPLHLKPCFAFLGYGEGYLPEAERASREVFAMPMFTELTAGERGWVGEGFSGFN